ncbi:MAG: hypothetical protein Q4E99_00805 [Bacillota bacterium]|nr:hypothetical protein [Bacillota bacterium]
MKKVISFVLVLTLMSGVIPVSVQTIYALQSSNWELLSNAFTQNDGTDMSVEGVIECSTSGATSLDMTIQIKLQTDVSFMLGEESIDSLIVPTGNKIELDLNGYVLNRGLVTCGGMEVSVSGSVIIIESGASLAIKDSKPNATHYFKIADSGLYILNDENPADEDNVIITGGCITGGTGIEADRWYFGGGLFVGDNGELTINGGNIIGNYANHGGGVFVKNGVLNMSDGTICGNGVYDNSCIGGGVGIGFSDNGVTSSGIFNMSGGTICDNISCYGGGVFISSDSILSLSEGATISNNTAEQGAGIFVSGYVMNYGYTSAGSFIMNGGLISGNHSYSYGGGVCLAFDLPNAYMNMVGGIITQNTTDVGGGGVSVLNEGKIILGGTAIITENYCGSNDNNLLLGSRVSAVPSQVVLDIDENVAPAAGMCVGITMNTVPVDGEPVTFSATKINNVAGHFFADNTDYYVANDGDTSLMFLEASDNKYDVWINSRQITVNNSDDVLHNSVLNNGIATVQYLSASSLLKLNNAIIAVRSSATGQENDNSSFGIKSTLPSLTIQFTGNNVIGKYSGKNHPDKEWKDYSLDYGIYCC